MNFWDIAVSCARSARGCFFFFFPFFFHFGNIFGLRRPSLKLQISFSLPPRRVPAVLTPQMALTLWYFNGHDMKNWDGRLPNRETPAQNSLLLTSKMTADVNPCFPLPERLTSQELPKADPQTVGAAHSQRPHPLCEAQEPVTCAAESGAFPCHQESWVPPHFGGQDPPLPFRPPKVAVWAV